MDTLIILGRQPELGLAELESLYGAQKITPAGTQAALVTVDPCFLAFDRLGGAVKFCKVLQVLETVEWKSVEQFLLRVAPEQSRRMPEGKMQLGLSAYDFSVDARQLLATGLALKKAIHQTGRTVRLIPNKEPALNTAQVNHNHLTGPNGWELVVVQDSNRTIIAQTVKVQDIESYTLRDRGRPKRDPRIGMLPPKLAQIIINLASGLLPEDKTASTCETADGQPLLRQKLGRRVLDPFCGTGVLLQEALLIGYDTYGTDLDQRMIAYSKANLAWLDQRFDFAGSYYLEAGDATSHQWSQPVDLVASEAYLGRPFTAIPDSRLLDQTIAECNTIIKKFLQNLHGQIPAGTRICLAVPAWQTRLGNFMHLPLVDQVKNLGYNRVSFEHVRKGLLYYRPNQIVARELLIITRN